MSCHNALAWNLAAPEVDTGHAGGEQRGAERPRRPVHEHRAGRNLRAIHADADDGRIADVELHWRLAAALVIEAVGAQPVQAGAQVQPQPLRLAAVAAARGEAQIAAVDLALERFSRDWLGTGEGGHGNQGHRHE